jgi:hypothetical protein
LRLQNNPIRLNRRIALGRTLPVLYAPALVARFNNHQFGRTIFITIEASTPCPQDSALSLRFPGLEVVGGHIVSTPLLAHPAPAPVEFLVQRWARLNCEVHSLLEGANLDPVDATAITGHLLCDQKPTSPFFCDWQVIQEAIQVCLKSLPLAVPLFAIPSVGREPRSDRDLVAHQDAHFRTFCVNTQADSISWTDLSVGLTRGDSFPLSSTSSAPSSNPCLIPTPRSDLNKANAEPHQHTNCITS